jgi:predicted dehydrogenase
MDTADSFEAVLDDPEVSGISLTVPHYLHAVMALRDLSRGKHVLIEKPMVLHATDGRLIRETALRNGLVAMPVAQHRFDPIITLVKQILDEGGLGTLCMMRAHLECRRDNEYYAGSNWRGSWAREGGSVLMNQAYHLVDLMLWFGGPIASVSAHATNLLHREQIETEDCLAATLLFASGTTGVLSVTGSGRQWGTHIEIVGERGGLGFDLDWPNRVLRWDFDDPADQDRENLRLAERQSAARTPAATYYGKSHRYQARVFVDAIGGMHNDIASDTEQAALVTETIHAMYQSAEQGTVARLAPVRHASSGIKWPDGWPAGASGDWAQR